MMSPNKRKRTRIPVHFDVSILLGEEVIREKILNVSMNGILCTSNPLFQIDTACKVIITLSDDIKITIDARILRIGDKETAINFLSMDNESFIHLRKLVEYNFGDADQIDSELQQQAFD